MSYLVAVDGSHASELAFDKALAMSKDTDTVYVVTVQEEVADTLALGFYDGVPSTAAGWAEKAQEAHHEAAKKLLQKFGHVAKDKGRKVTLLLAHGEPAEAIVEEANSRKVDTIVIGRRHLGSVHRFFVGSASQYVVEHAEANVIVVHDRTPEEA